MSRLSPPRKSEAPAGASSRDRILQAAKSLFAGKGYENTSTVAIARMAGTSESQLMKHFGSKEGMLEAIFDEGWQKTNWGVRQALQALSSPTEKLRTVVELILTALEKDRELKQLMLLEGRRIRREGNMVLLTQGFVEFVSLVDGLLRQMHNAGQLRPEVHLEAARCALMGALEGLMRDRILAQRVAYPAHYSSKEVRETFNLVLSGFLVPAEL